MDDDLMISIIFTMYSYNNPSYVVEISNGVDTLKGEIRSPIFQDIFLDSVRLYHALKKHVFLYKVLKDCGISFPTYGNEVINQIMGFKEQVLNHKEMFPLLIGISKELDKILEGNYNGYPVR